MEEKLDLPIPEKATLAQIALPLPLPFLGLDQSISEHIIDCQDFRGFSQYTLGNRRPFLVRFRRESDFSEILRKVAKGLSQQDINPDEIFFICADEHFKPFAFAYFGDSDTEDWYVEVLNIFTWTQGNTRINTGFEHDLSALFSSTESSTEFDDTTETKSTSSSYRGKPDASKDLLIKLQDIGTPLGRHKDYNIHTGINLAYKNAFVINEDSNSADLLIEQFPDKPEKWRWELRSIIYMPNHKNKPQPWSGIRNESEAEQIFKETYPVISKHMDNYKDRLKKSVNAVPFYWEFPPRNILQELERPKIIYRAVACSMQAAYDTSYRFLTSATHFIATDDLSLLAILNSKPFGWYARRKWRHPNPNIRQLRFAKENMNKAPIAQRTEEQKAKLSDLVQQILKDPDSLEVPDIEQEIDQLVYKLYELTPAEIALIEEETNP
ncbi:MAG: hypothetical protein OYL97_10920 [Candidatus Poribacteria bacterium]|nr:hypothetical protein [Candidatus Poribacteria bacterium]